MWYGYDFAKFETSLVEELIQLSLGDYGCLFEWTFGCLWGHIWVQPCLC